MIFVLISKSGSRFAADLAVMHCQRKTAFVDRAGWKIPVIWDQEIDRYDLLEGTVCAAPRTGCRFMHLLLEIICGVMELGLARDVDHVIFAASRALLPLALECGWDATTVGATTSDGNDQVTAVVAAIAQSGLRRMRDRHRAIDAPYRLRADITAGRFPRGRI